MTTTPIDPALEKVAQRYLDAAYGSIVGRTVRDTRDHRYESRGILLALEIMIGMDEALRLIERTHAGASRHGAGVSIDLLLYSFWSLDRPSDS